MENQHLLKQINNPNQPIELMLKDVKDAVSNDTNGNQLPWYESSITGDFCFKTTSEGCAKFIRVIYDPYLEGLYDIDTLEFKNGDKYVGQTLNSLMHGKGVLTYETGIIHRGEFVEGKRHGEAIITYLNGNRFEGSFVDDKRHGKAITSYISGAEVETEWDMGEHSFLESFFEILLIRFTSLSDSTLIKSTFFLIAILISSSVLPTPEKTIFFALIPAFVAFNNSPTDTTSAPEPIFFNSFNKVRFEFDFIEKQIIGLIVLNALLKA